MSRYRRLFVFNTSDKKATKYNNSYGLLYRTDKGSLAFSVPEKTILFGSIVNHIYRGKRNHRSYPVYSSECIFGENSVLNNVIVKEEMFYGKI